MLTEPRFANRPPVTDTDYVLQSAGALGVGAFNLFELADRWWHGDGRPDAALERIFVHFLRTGAAPPWVRQFCDAVLELANNGKLDPRRFGARPLRTRPLARWDGRGAVMLQVGAPALLLVVYLILQNLA